MGKDDKDKKNEGRTRALVCSYRSVSYFFE